MLTMRAVPLSQTRDIEAAAAAIAVRVPGAARSTEAATTAEGEDRAEAGVVSPSFPSSSLAVYCLRFLFLLSYRLS